MAQKSKKAKPDDHETHDSAIRLPWSKKAKIGFWLPWSKKAKKQNHVTMKTNDSAIRLIGFLAPMEQKSKKSITL